MAAEMLELQAIRASRPGISFRVETEWQHEFDASFPYKETADQLTTLEAIKQDMKASRPMDRLLCGDVGYGKTEVAMRAAFKAIDSGYQVAVLVPTTVLAEQHLRTFSARMAEFPFSIAALSRFSTPRQQAEIVGRLAAGSIDILITDVIMPQMNGRDLSRRLLSVNPRMKCLFISGYTADVIGDKGLLDEGVHFLSKPFTTSQLASKIREVLDGGAREP